VCVTILGRINDKSYDNTNGKMLEEKQKNMQYYSTLRNCALLENGNNNKKMSTFCVACVYLLSFLVFQFYVLSQVFAGLLTCLQATSGWLKF